MIDHANTNSALGRMTEAAQVAFLPSADAETEWTHQEQEIAQAFHRCVAVDAAWRLQVGLDAIAESHRRPSSDG